MRFRDFSIRLKLIVLLGASAALALSISVAMSLLLTFLTQRSESLRHLQQIASIASDNLTAALAFRDNASAERLLNALHTTPHILAAAIYDEQRQPFSAYRASGAAPPAVAQFLAQLPQLLARHQELQAIDADFMYVITPINFDGKVIGSLLLLSDNQELKQKLGYFVAMYSAIVVLTLVIIVFISIWLQRIFTAPIFSMIDVIRTIAKTKNYAVNVETVQNDEFKVLYQHFNDMIAEIRQRDLQLTRLATTDALTGLANRRYAMETLQTLVTRTQRKGEFFGLVMLDVDHFKHINDTYGHPVGDTVLKQVAAILSQEVREYELVARIGGEEFLVLCDNSSLEGTRTLAERIRSAIEQAIIPYDEAGQTLHITVSAGVFAACPQSPDIEIPLSRVDQALYRAKHSGRNRVCIWEST